MNYECAVCLKKFNFDDKDYEQYCDCCPRKFCSEECIQDEDVDPVNGSGVYSCILCRNEKNKYKCTVCGVCAKWYYEPSRKGKIEKQNYYCDDCVNRGCGCNLIIDKDGNETDEELKDDRGRLLPCCEYSHSKEGFEIK